MSGRDGDMLKLWNLLVGRYDVYGSKVHWGLSSMILLVDRYDMHGSEVDRALSSMLYG